MKTIFDHLNNMLAIDILHRHNTCIVAGNLPQPRNNQLLVSSE